MAEMKQVRPNYWFADDSINYYGTEPEDHSGDILFWTASKRETRLQNMVQGWKKSKLKKDKTYSQILDWVLWDRDVAGPKRVQAEKNELIGEYNKKLDKMKRELDQAKDQLQKAQTFQAASGKGTTKTVHKTSMLSRVIWFGFGGLSAILALNIVANFIM